LHELIVFLQLNLHNIISLYYDATYCSCGMGSESMFKSLNTLMNVIWKVFFKLTLLLIWYFYWPAWGIYNRSYQRVSNRWLDEEKT